MIFIQRCFTNMPNFKLISLKTKTKQKFLAFKIIGMNFNFKMASVSMTIFYSD